MKMQYDIEISDDGKFTLPTEVCEALGIVPGKSTLNIDIVDGKVMISKQ